MGSTAVLYNKVLFFFPFDKKTLKLYITVSRFGSPSGSERACYGTASRPSAWVMKAEHLPPTLPGPQKPPAPHWGGGSALRALTGGQEDGAETASPAGTAGLRDPWLPHLPHTPLHGLPRSFAWLRAQSQHQTGSQLHATGEFLLGQGLVLWRHRLKYIPQIPHPPSHGQALPAATEDEHSSRSVVPGR